MKSSTKKYILIEIILAALVVLFMLLMLQGKNVKKPDKVSIIVQNSDDEQWAAFKYGLEKAAEDKGLKLSFVSTGSSIDAAYEQEIIEREIENGADAFIVQPVSDEAFEEMLKKYSDNYPMIIVKQTADVSGKKMDFTIIGTDDYSMGLSLAENIISDNKDISEKRVGIISNKLDTENESVREKGLLKGLEDSGVKISWSISNSDVKKNLSRIKNVDIIVTLDDTSTRTVGDYFVTENYHDSLLYGIGHSMKSIYYLDMSYAECLIVPDEFNIGYYSVVEIAKKLKGDYVEKESTTFSYNVLRKENLFSDENQKLLFIMNQ